MVGGFGGNLKPALGQSWQYVPNVRAELRRTDKQAVRIATLTKSTRQVCSLGLSLGKNKQ